MIFSIIWGNDFFDSGTLVNMPFYVDLDGHAFPDREWTDFGVVVLEWWLSTLLNARKKEDSAFELLFMDGPFYIECIKKNQIVQMCFVDERQGKTQVYEKHIPFNELFSTVLDTAEGLLAYSAQYNYTTNSVNELMETVALVRTQGFGLQN